MDNGTNDLLTSLLSNPESLKMLMGVAKSFLSSTPAQQVQSSSNSQSTALEVTENLPSDNELATVPAISQQAVEASAVITKKVPDSFDERTNLIKSIKPYLAPSKRQKADSLIQALNVAKMINAYTNTGTSSDN